MKEFSNEAINNWLTPHQKSLVARAVEKLQRACHVQESEKYELFMAVYNEIIEILKEFNPFIQWDTLCKYCCDRGYIVK